LDEAQRAPPNRLLHELHPNDFLRVSLIDDNGEPLSHIGDIDEENMYDEWICKHLDHIDLLGDMLDCFGCSNSQLKAHDCYMYKSPVHARNRYNRGRPKSASEIREWAGDLEKICCVPKYMARFGLALSALKMKVQDGDTITM
jgi:hypothetical protein